MSGLLLLSFLVGCDGEEGGGAAVPAPRSGPAPLELRVSYGSEKKTWMEAMVARFEATSPKTGAGRPIDVVTQAAGSGEAMSAILSGKAQPHVFSPASSAYITLLDEAWLSQAGNTRPLAPAGDALVLSPIVIAMWRPMAEALGWPATPVGWKDLLAITTDAQGWAGHGHPEWGLFKMAHTHPAMSNSGLLAVLAEAYAGSGKSRGLTPEDLATPTTEAFVAAVEGSLVHYGKSTSFVHDKMLSRGPSYVSAAVLYENLVIESYRAPTPPAMPVVAIYPAEGTFWSDHPYSVLDAPWVGDEEREAAKQLQDFLRATPQQQSALEYGFRPADPAIPVGAPLDAAHGVDPLQPQNLLEVPSGATLTALLGLFERTKKTSEIVLVFDKSGSMEGEPLTQAKAGAGAFLDALGDRDAVGILFFDNRVPAAPVPEPLGAGGRERLKARVDGALASGGTSLYDAVDLAYAAELARAQEAPGIIHAVVVMTDGRDESSQLELDVLRQRLSARAEAPVKVFTIAYGEGADPTVLAELAEAGKGSTAKGASSDIATIFQDMAAFF